MPIWEWALDVLASVVVAAALLLLCLVGRRRWLTRGEATFEMSVRMRGFEGVRGWTLGVARYRGDRLEWFRVFSLAPRPKRMFDRRLLEVVSNREPDEQEAYALFSGHLVVDGTSAGTQVQMAVSPEALTALLAWLEAAPPAPGRG